jgi:cytochrome c-type biogenesis protein CcmF
VNPGAAFITAACVATVVSLAGYARFVKSDRPPRWPRLAFHAGTVLLVLAGLVLLEALLAHRFQYGYVASYTDRSLSVFYLVSAFWAGQEGTFLLWAIFVGALGWMVSRRAGDLEAPIMLALAVNQIALIVLIIRQSPFAQLGFLPPDGRGLNELLQDPWMVIHPPVVFLGYAALTVPWAYGFAAAVRRRLSAWLRPAMPWAVFGTATLGAGVFLGGFWAYKTLGWGGYWGWDPVENASLVPWLTGVALVHSLATARAGRGLARTSVVLAPVTYLLVVYATFLTRSGVLADFSVHSFAGLGLSAYILMWMAVVAVVSVWVCIRVCHEAGKNLSRIPAISPYRETGMAWAVIVLCLFAALVFVGMSAPILTSFIGDPSRVEPSFYNRTALPVGIVLVLLLFSAPFTRWANGGYRELLRRTRNPVVFGIAVVIAGVIAGMRNALHLLFLFAGASAVFANASVVRGMLRRGWRAAGGAFAHVGVGLMAVGIIATGGYAAHERAVLHRGEPTQALGHTLTFVDYVFRGGGPQDDWIIEVSSPREYVASPEMYTAKTMEGVMRNPDVHRTLLADYYIAPLEYVVPDGGGHKHVLTEFTPDSIAGVEVAFTGFDMSMHGGEGETGAGATLRVKSDNNEAVVVPVMVVGPGGTRSEPVALPFTDGVEVRLVRISVEERAVVLDVSDADSVGDGARPYLVVEFMRQPLINVLWVGIVFVMLGTLIASYRRFGERNGMDG